MWPNLGDQTSLLMTYILWIGGDAARFRVDDIVSRLPVEKGVVESVLHLLEKRKLLLCEGNFFTVSSSGSYFMDWALLREITNWNLISFLIDEPDYHTLQRIFVLREGLSPQSLRQRYILDFCHSFMEEVGTLIDADWKQYEPLRNFVIRTSLFPTNDFVLSIDRDRDVSIIVEKLLRKKALKISDELGSNALLFNSRGVFKTFVYREQRVRGAKEKT